MRDPLFCFTMYIVSCVPHMYGHSLYYYNAHSTSFVFTPYLHVCSHFPYVCNMGCMEHGAELLTA